MGIGPEQVCLTGTKLSLATYWFSTTWLVPAESGCGKAGITIQENHKASGGASGKHEEGRACTFEKNVMCVAVDIPVPCPGLFYDAIVKRHVWCGKSLRANLWSS